MNRQPILDFVIKQTETASPFKYSVCTLVNNPQEYQEMVQSFIDAGFDKELCEYRYVDNTTNNSFDAYKGYNLFLQNALGKYIILCHQDVLLNYDGIAQLDQRIAEMDAIDPNWGILSNAGGIENDLYKRFVVNIAYPDKYNRVGTFPQKIVSADENFIIVKRSANLALSTDLEGYHLYGTDLCLIASLLGYTAYVIDFKILHKSYGNPNDGYHNVMNKLVAKYSHFMRGRRIVTTIADFYLSPSKWRSVLAETKFVKKISRKLKKIKLSWSTNN